MVKSYAGLTVRTKIELIDKYRQPRKQEVPVSEAERIESKKKGNEITHKVMEYPAIFATANANVKIIGDHDNVMIVENAQGHRISVESRFLELPNLNDG